MLKVNTRAHARSVTDADRRSYVGSSDVDRLMAGDMHQVWLEKTGRVPERKVESFQADLGKATQSVNLRWFMRGHPTLRLYEFEQALPSYLVCLNEQPRVACTPDGLLMQPDAWPERFSPPKVLQAIGGVDAKHRRADLLPSQVLREAWWQCVHFCNVLDVESWWLSPIYGNELGEALEVIPTTDDRANLDARIHELLHHLDTDTPPPGAGTTSGTSYVAATPQPATPYGKLRVIKLGDTDNMTPDFVAAAGEYLDNQVPALRFDAAKSKLKTIMPADCRLLVHPTKALALVRNKGNAVSMTTEVEKAIATHEGIA